MNVIAHLAVNVLGAALLHAARRKSGWHNFPAIAGLGPFAPSRFEELQKTLVMNPCHGLHVQCLWWNDIIHLALLEFAQDVFHP